MRACPEYVGRSTRYHHGSNVTRILLLCRLWALLACAGKDTDEQSADADPETDSGAVDSGGDTDSGTTDTSACAPVQETCNGVDDDCDGAVDEEDAADATAYYADADTDGYGNPAAAVTACAMPEGYVTDNRDCDDSSALAHPGLEEIAEDGLDNDCDPNSTVPTLIYDAFSTDRATNGNWTLGYARNADPSFFSPMTSYLQTPYSGVDAWRYTSVDSLTIYRNYTSSTIRNDRAFFPGRSLILHPGSGYAAAMRWTAPVATECTFEVIFTGCDNTSTIATAYAAGTVFADGLIDGNGEEVYGTTRVAMAAGDTLDLIVDANGDKNYDSTCIDAFLFCR